MRSRLPASKHCYARLEAARPCRGASQVSCFLTAGCARAQVPYSCHCVFTHVRAAQVVALSGIDHGGERAVHEGHERLARACPAGSASLPALADITMSNACARSGHQQRPQPRAAWRGGRLVHVHTLVCAATLPTDPKTKSRTPAPGGLPKSLSERPYSSSKQFVLALGYLPVCVQYRLCASNPVQCGCTKKLRIGERTHCPAASACAIQGCQGERQSMPRAADTTAAPITCLTSVCLSDAC